MASTTRLPLNCALYRLRVRCSISECSCCRGSRAAGGEAATEEAEQEGQGRG